MNFRQLIEIVLEKGDLLLLRHATTEIVVFVLRLFLRLEESSGDSHIEPLDDDNEPFSIETVDLARTVCVDCEEFAILWPLSLRDP